MGSDDGFSPPDCETAIFAKLGGFPYWPARLATKAEADDYVMHKRQPDHICVYFFGSSSFGWVPQCNIREFTRKTTQEFSRSVKGKAFQNGLKEAMAMARGKGAGGSSSNSGTEKIIPWSEADLGLCKTCNRSAEFGVILVCDGCANEFHLKCCNPPLHAVPEGDWHCHECVRKHKRAGRGSLDSMSPAPARRKSASGVGTPVSSSRGRGRAASSSGGAGESQSSKSRTSSTRTSLYPERGSAKTTQEKDVKSERTERAERADRYNNSYSTLMNGETSKSSTKKQPSSSNRSARLSSSVADLSPEPGDSCEKAKRPRGRPPKVRTESSVSAQKGASPAVVSQKKSADSKETKSKKSSRTRTTSVDGGDEGVGYVRDRRSSLGGSGTGDAPLLMLDYGGNRKRKMSVSEQDAAEPASKKIKDTNGKQAASNTSEGGAGGKARVPASEIVEDPESSKVDKVDEPKKRGRPVKGRNKGTQTVEAELPLPPAQQQALDDMQAQIAALKAMPFNTAGVSTAPSTSAPGTLTAGPTHPHGDRRIVHVPVVPSCFVCKQSVEGWRGGATGGGSGFSVATPGTGITARGFDGVRCSVRGCGISFHANCVRHILPQHLGEGDAAEEALAWACPHHKCITCGVTDGRAFFSDGSLTPTLGPVRPSTRRLAAVAAAGMSGHPLAYDAAGSGSDSGESSSCGNGGFQTLWCCATCPAAFCKRHAPPALAATRSGKRSRCPHCLRPSPRVKLAQQLEAAWSRAGNSYLAAPFLRPFLPGVITTSSTKPSAKETTPAVLPSTQHVTLVDKETESLSLPVEPKEPVPLPLSAAILSNVVLPAPQTISAVLETNAFSIPIQSSTVPTLPPSIPNPIVTETPSDAMDIDHQSEVDAVSTVGKESLNLSAEEGSSSSVGSEVDKPPADLLEVLERVRGMKYASRADFVTDMESLVTKAKDVVKAASACEPVDAAGGASSTAAGGDSADGKGVGAPVIEAIETLVNAAVRATSSEGGSPNDTTQSNGEVGGKDSPLPFTSESFDGGASSSNGNGYPHGGAEWRIECMATSEFSGLSPALVTVVEGWIPHRTLSGWCEYILAAPALLRSTGVPMPGVTLCFNGKEVSGGSSGMDGSNHGMNGSHAAGAHGAEAEGSKKSKAVEGEGAGKKSKAAADAHKGKALDTEEVGKKAKGDGSSGKAAEKSKSGASTNGGTSSLSKSRSTPSPAIGPKPASSKSVPAIGGTGKGGKAPAPPPAVSSTSTSAAPALKVPAAMPVIAGPPPPPPDWAELDAAIQVLRAAPQRPARKADGEGGNTCACELDTLIESQSAALRMMIRRNAVIRMLWQKERDRQEADGWGGEGVISLGDASPLAELGLANKSLNAENAELKARIRELEAGAKQQNEGGGSSSTGVVDCLSDQEDGEEHRAVLESDDVVMVDVDDASLQNGPGIACVQLPVEPDEAIAEEGEPVQTSKAPLLSRNSPTSAVVSFDIDESDHEAVPTPSKLIKDTQPHSDVGDIEHQSVSSSSAPGASSSPPALVTYAASPPSAERNAVIVPRQVPAPLSTLP